LKKGDRMKEIKSSLRFNIAKRREAEELAKNPRS
jgi:hypothetical protein